MANAEEQKEPVPGKDGETPSMEEILQSIRGVISGEDAAQGADDVLELTDAVEEVEIANVKADSGNTEKSILDDIDAALDDNKSAKEPEIVQQEILPEPVVEAAPVVEPKIESKIEPEVKNEEAVDVGSVDQAGVAEEDADTLEADLTVNDGGEDSYSTAKIGKLLNKEVVKKSSVPLQELVNTIHDKHVDSPYSRGGTSLEDLVIEAMRPFLAEWLNKNLPVIVRKIVTKEVKRLIPKDEDDD